jgi:cell wall-associated NlpC family hydrolase
VAAPLIVLGGVPAAQADPSPASSSTSSSTTSTVPPPTQAQINATQSQVGSIEQSIQNDQQKGAVLAQEYDAAQQQLQQDEAVLAATRSTLGSTQAALDAARRRLRNSAVNAYVYGNPSASVAALFNSSATTADAQSLYASTVIGDVAAAASAVRTDQSRLDAQQAAQKAQEQKAEAAAQHAQTLQDENNDQVNLTESALAVVKGTLANQVAAAAEAQAQRDAAAAALASNPALAQQDAGAAAAALGTAQAANPGGTVTPPTLPTGGTSPVVPTVPVGPSGATGGPGATAVTSAESQLGVPYQYGGETPEAGFDCSGLAQWSWRQAGAAIPRTTEDQWAVLPKVPLTQLQPGDLLYYFNLDGDNEVDHVVMFVGSGMYGPDTVIQAAYQGTTIAYSPLFTEGLIGAARP